MRGRQAEVAVTAAVIAALATLGIGASSAAARQRPSLSLNLPRTAIAGDQIPFSWSGRNLGPHHRLVLQHPEGTAHTWRTIMPLRGNSGHAAVPLLDLGKYRFRIADLAGHHVLAKQTAGVEVFGQVPFSTLWGRRNRNKVFVTETASFPFVSAWENSAEPAFAVERNHCRSVHIEFVGHSPWKERTGTSDLTVVQESHGPTSASAHFETIGTVDAALVPGQSWALNIGAELSDPAPFITYINGYAVCDSREPFN